MADLYYFSPLNPTASGAGLGAYCRTSGRLLYYTGPIDVRGVKLVWFYAAGAGSPAFFVEHRPPCTGCELCDAAGGSRAPSWLEEDSEPKLTWAEPRP